MSESPKGPDEYQQMRNEGHDEYSAHAFNQLPIPIMDPHVQDLSQQDILHAHESHPHHHPTSQHQEHHFNMGMSMMTHYNPYPQHHQHHAYMNPLHMQGFHHAQQGRFQTGRDFVPFSSIPLTLIEGGFNSQGGCPDGSVGPTPGAPMDFQQHFMHFSPGIPHTMMGMGMVGVGMDGNPAFHFDKRPDSPNAWGWVTNEGQIPGAPGGEAGESMSQPGMMDGGPMGHTDIVGDGHLEVDPITGQPLLPIPQPQTYMMDNGARQGFLGGMSGAGVPNEDGEGMPSGTSSSSNQDGEEYDGNKTSRTDKNMRRGKGAVYCMHRKLLNRCPDCSSLGNPSHVITRVSAVCHHGKRRSQCIQCYDEGTGGSIICEHRRQKYACPKCFDAGRETKSLCVHRTIKFKCKICSPSVHQPKTYKKRANSKHSTAGDDAEHPSPYAAKKRGGRQKREQLPQHGDGRFDLGAGMAPENGNGGMGDMAPQQQPMFYHHHHHPMMFSLPMNPHQMQPHDGNMAGQAPGYMFRSAPHGMSVVPVVPHASNGGVSYHGTTGHAVSTPIATRHGSPELNKIASFPGQQHSGFVSAGGAGGLSIMVPTMLPLSFPMHGATSAIMTPTISPPAINIGISIAADVPPPNKPGFGMPSSTHTVTIPKKLKERHGFDLKAPLSPTSSPHINKAGVEASTSKPVVQEAANEPPASEVDEASASSQSSSGSEAEEAAATMVTILRAAQTAETNEAAPLGEESRQRGTTGDAAPAFARPMAPHYFCNAQGQPVVVCGSGNSGASTPSYYYPVVMSYGGYYRRPHSQQRSRAVSGSGEEACIEGQVQQPLFNYQLQQQQRQRQSSSSSLAAPPIECGIEECDAGSSVCDESEVGSQGDVVAQE